MTSISLHNLMSYKGPAEQLAQWLDIPCHDIDIHIFPDGESKIKVTPVAGTAIVYASLIHPNDKLIQLALIVSALRENGTQRLILVAPYLCYMRQDKSFSKGEAVSQQVIGRFLASLFDRVITVDPHLHRITNLQDVFPNCTADSLTASDPISEALAADPDTTNRILVGPDSESAQWVGRLSDKTQIPFIVAEKQRKGDRSVAITLPQGVDLSGHHAIIVDDVISSGMTICRCAEELTKAGCTKIEVIVTHILSRDVDIARIHQSGVSLIRSTDSVEHATNMIPLAGLLATALKKEL